MHEQSAAPRGRRALALPPLRTPLGGRGVAAAAADILRRRALAVAAAGRHAGLRACDGERLGSKVRWAFLCMTASGEHALGNTVDRHMAMPACACARHVCCVMHRCDKTAARACM